jgi:Bacterial Ig-like domain (group 3)
MRRGIISWMLFAVVSVAMFHGATAWASSPLTPGSVSTPLGVDGTLGESGFGDLVIDDANQHVFVSSPAANVVQVYGFSGNLVASISGIAGADGMVIHGSTLYVAASTTGDIVAINLSTLADEGPFATGLVDPGWLVYAGGELWTEQYENGNQSDQLASISLAGDPGDVTVFPTTYYSPDLATSSGTPNYLYAAEDGLEPGAIYKFDVSSGSPVLVASNPFTDQSNIDDLAVSVDGTEVIPASSLISSESGTSHGIEELSASTLTADGVIYPDQSYPSAVAVSSADGGLLATGLSDSDSSEPNLSVFPLGNTSALYTGSASGPSYAGSVMAHGLALSADGSRMFAITSDWDGSGENYRLWTYNLDSTTTSTNVTSSIGTPNFGQGVTLKAAVTPTDGGGTVAFEADGSVISDCGSVPLVSGPSGETASCATTSLASGLDGVTAVYSGDLSYSSSTGSTQVTVATAWTPGYSWDGSATDAGWSSGANWVGGAGPVGSGNSSPAGTVGILTFPNLTSTACAETSPTDACYNPGNDLSGLSAYGLQIDSDDAYAIDGDALTLGADGLLVESPSGDGAPPTFQLPITLGASQDWLINEGPVVFNDAVNGSQQVTMSFDNGSVEPSAGLEVGPVLVEGDNDGDGDGGGLYLDGDMAVNSTDLNPVEATADGGIEADGPGNSVGPLTLASEAWLSVGGVNDGAGELAVHGALSFNSNSELDLAVDAPGTTAGLDYSQVTATGDINLNGAELFVSQGVDVDGSCDDLAVGNTLTLISTSGGRIDGTFSNYANGASVDIADECNGADQEASGTLSYSSSAVTLTITSVGDVGDVPVELSAPSITGAAQEGQTLQVDPGGWRGQPSYEYSWWECDSDTCSQIPGATSSTFVPTSAQLGDELFAYVTAVGSVGSNTDYTDNTAAVVAEPVPSISVAPTISGNNSVGDVLTATTGAWSNSPTSYGYQWERCSSAGSHCLPISGASRGSYTLTSADTGFTIEIQITAANYGGSGSPASSTSTGAVTSSGSKASSAPPVSVTSVRSALRQIVYPAGKDATLTELLRRHGYVFSFSAPAAGRLSVTWTATIKRKKVTVARGSANVSSARSVKFKVALTSQGTRDVNRYSRLNVTSNATFKTPGLRQVTRSGAFTFTRGASPRSPRLVEMCTSRTGSETQASGCSLDPQGPTFRAEALGIRMPPMARRT